MKLEYSTTFNKTNGATYTNYILVLDNGTDIVFKPCFSQDYATLGYLIGKGIIAPREKKGDK